MSGGGAPEDVYNSFIGVNILFPIWSTVIETEAGKIKKTLFTVQICT